MAEQPGYVGPFDQWSGNTDFHAIQFLVRMLAGQMATATLVTVEAVNTGGGGPDTVDIRPMVAQVNGQGQTTDHGVIFGVPFFRLQGGANAVVIDPNQGDIGIAVFASRDISVVKSTQAPGPPGSFRQFDMADAIYLGGLLNGVPTQLVQFDSDGITVLSPVKVTVVAPAILMADAGGDTAVTINGTLEVSGTIEGGETATFAGEVTGGGVALSTHAHGGVTVGGGNTGPPV